MIAELNVCYTLEEFRENDMPDAEHSLLFRLNNITVDCDVGTLDVSKFRPVKIDVGSGASPVWAGAESAESDGKLQLFCADMLKRHVCSRPLIPGQLPDYAPRRSKNPFDNREIRGVQYLTQGEIDEQVALYGQVEDDVQILTHRLETLEADKLSLENEIEELRDEGKNTRAKEALLNMTEQNITAANLSLEQSTAAQRSLITTLRYDHTVDDEGTLLTPLFAAIGENDQDAVEEFLRNGADPNEVDEDGYNALHWGAYIGCRLTTFNLILEKIEDVNAVTPDSLDTALMLAARRNHLDIVGSLMNHPDIQLNVQNRTLLNFEILDETALHMAVVWNHPAIVRQLLSDDRIDTSLKNHYGRTPLMQARKDKDKSDQQDERRHILEMLERFIYERAMAKYSSNSLVPPINYALAEKDEESADALLTGGQNPNQVDEIDWNALHTAAFNGCSLPLFNRILGMTHNVNAVDYYDKYTALILAADQNHLEMVTALLNHPMIDVNVATLQAIRHHTDRPVIIAMIERFRYDHAMTKYGGEVSPEPPLNAALKAHDEDAIDALLTGLGLDSRADPNKINQYGQNALHIAAKEGCSSHLFGRILALILNKNAVAAGGVTALMLASQMGRLKMVQTILHLRTFSGPVDLNVQDSSRGFTALHHAVNNEHLDVVHELLLRLTPASQSQIDITLRDSNGRTALDLAMENGNSDIIRLLQDAFRYLSAQDVDVDVDNTMSEVFTLKF